MRPRSAVCFFVAGLCVACSGGGSSMGTASVLGTFKGLGFQAADAISANISAGGSSTAGAIIIANNGGLCGLVNANKAAKSSQYLFLVIADLNAATQQSDAPTSAGTYSASSDIGLPPQKIALVTYQPTDANCQVTGAFEVALPPSTVTVTNVNNGAYSGTFDISLRPSNGAAADQVTGSFNAASCPALGSLTNLTQPASCIYGRIGSNARSANSKYWARRVSWREDSSSCDMDCSLHMRLRWLTPSCNQSPTRRGSMLGASRSRRLRVQQLQWRWMLFRA